MVYRLQFRGWGQNYNQWQEVYIIIGHLNSDSVLQKVRLWQGI